MAFMSISMFVFNFISLHTGLDAISYVAFMWVTPYIHYYWF
jgi:hypothetical protein